MFSDGFTTPPPFLSLLIADKQTRNKVFIREFETVSLVCKQHLQFGDDGPPLPRKVEPFDGDDESWNLVEVVQTVLGDFGEEGFFEVLWIELKI